MNDITILLGGLLAWQFLQTVQISLLTRRVRDVQQSLVPPAPQKQQRPHSD